MNKLTNIKLYNLLCQEYPYIIKHAYTDPKIKDNGEVSLVRKIIINYMVGEPDITYDDLFNRMQVKRGNWPRLYLKAYEWISDETNESLLQMRML
ncbi:hypothetical protein KAU11_09690 [Candidatus Babeliales bacterium]|nr:hypothetical protein [Candidatus Babeliales bacterium]